MLSLGQWWVLGCEGQGDPLSQDRVVFSGLDLAPFVRNLDIQATKE